MEMKMIIKMNKHIIWWKKDPEIRIQIQTFALTKITKYLQIISQLYSEERFLGRW